MKIGIDISQTAYTGTGVANFLMNLVAELTKRDEVELVLFYSSFRSFGHSFPFLSLKSVTLRRYPFPARFLDFIWNRMHVFAIEKFIGNVDVFISSDWTQPPVKSSKNVTILYDLIVYKFPEETDAAIVATQKRRLSWVKKECDTLLCISEATKKDAIEILGLAPEKLKVVYPGI